MSESEKILYLALTFLFGVWGAVLWGLCTVAIISMFRETPFWKHNITRAPNERHAAGVFVASSWTGRP